MKPLKCIAAASVLLAGLLAAQPAMADEITGVVIDNVIEDEAEGYTGDAAEGFSLDTAVDDTIGFDGEDNAEGYTGDIAEEEIDGFADTLGEDVVSLYQRDSYRGTDGNLNLRFVTEVRDDGSISKFGTWIVSEDYFSNINNTFESNVKVKAEGSGEITTLNEENNRCFTADLMGIPSNYADTIFYAKSFVQFENGFMRNSDIKYTTPKVRTGDDRYKLGASSFETKFVNNDLYLYRVGNIGTVSLGTLFKAREGMTIDSTAVTVDISPIDGTAASGTWTKNISDWTKGTIQFKDTGVVKVTINDGSLGYELLLEVVDAVNATSAQSATSNNVVLLNDVGFSSVTVSNGYAIYGNGFTMTSTSDISGRYMSYGYVTLDNGTLDNVQVICPNFSQQFLYTSNNAYKNSVKSDGTYPNSRCGVSMSGNSKILNSYISGGRAAVYVTGQTQQIINSTINGGAVANIHIASADSLLLRDVTTIQVPTQATVNDTSKELLGLGVITVCEADGTSTPVTLEGTLRQYNWANSSYRSYVPSAAEFVLTSALGNDKFVHEFDGSKWVNLGFAYLPFEPGKPTKINITDNRSNKDSMPYLSESISGGKVYSYANTNGTDEELKQKPDYNSYTYDYVAPQIRFNETSSLCTYSNGNKTLTVKLDDNNPEYTLDFSYITISKYGDIPYEIYENETKVTDTAVVLDSSATRKYTLKFDDTIFYDKNGNKVEKTVHYEYPLTVAVSLTSLPAPTSLAPSTHDALVVASSHNDTWHIATPALNGIKVKAWNADLNDWEEIDLSVFCLSKSGQQSTDKTITLTSNKGTLTVTAPNPFQSSKSIYGKPVVVDGELYFVPTSTTGMVNYGNTARSVVLNYTFKDTNNKSCSFSITFSGGNKTHDGYTQYNYSDFVNGKKTELTASSGGGGGNCLAEGTLITLADGTQKPIEQLTFDDELVVWDFFKGEYTVSKPSLLIYDGLQDWNVINLRFSDGTVLRVIYEHGLYDVNSNGYVYINKDNAASYVGHDFVRYVNGENKTVRLTDYEITNEHIGCYTLLTAYYNNCIANGLLTVTPPPQPGWYDYFKIGEGMKYDEALMQADIAKYGLYDYSAFSDYVSYDEFLAFNGPYMKILVEKGLITYEDIIKQINEFVYISGQSADNNPYLN